MRLSPFLAILVSILVASAGHGQVKGPSKVVAEVGKLTAVPLTVVGDQIKYEILGGDTLGAFREFTAPSEIRFQVLGYKPGVGYITIASLDGTTLSLFTVEITVTGVGPTPVPPGPDPPPPDPRPPPPVPTGIVKFVVVVEETADATAARGIYLADLTLAARLKDKGIRIRVVDKDVVGVDGKPPADVARFIEEAKGKKLARVYLVGDKGQLLYSGNMPEDPARLIEILSKFGG